MTLPIYLPTEKACRDYGYARVPKKHSGKSGFNSNETVRKNGLPDFLTGEQFFGSEGSSNTFNRVGLNENSELVQTILKKTKPNFNVDKIEDIQSEGSNKIDEIVVEVLTNIIYSRRYETTSLGTKRAIYTSDSNNATTKANGYKKGKELSLSTYRILTEDDGIQINHNHDWGDQDGVVKRIVDTGVDFTQRFANGVNMVDRATTGDPLQPARQYKLDISDTYKGSERPEITVKFILFTSDDFINDIFAPLMSLCYYSTASRFPPNNAEGARSLFESLIDNFQDDETGEISELRDQIRDSGDIVNTLNRLIPGMRILVTEPPPFFRVWHSSGLFYYDHMALTNVDYSFKKPFYNKRLNSLFGNSEQLSKNQGIYNSTSEFEKASFPVYAEVSLTFQGVDPLFSGDIINWMNYLDPSLSKEIINIRDNATFNTSDELSQVEQNNLSRRDDIAQYRRAAVASYGNSDEDPHLFCKEYGRENNGGVYNSNGAAQRDCERALFNSDQQTFCENSDLVENTQEACLSSEGALSIRTQFAKQYDDGISTFSTLDEPDQISVSNNGSGRIYSTDNNQLERRDLRE